MEPEAEAKLDNPEAPRWRVRARGEDIRRFILAQIDKHSQDIASVTSEHFGITRQAVNKHLQKLTAEKALVPDGRTRNRSYKLGSLQEWRGEYPITPSLAEDQVWTRDIQPFLRPLPQNVMDIWHYAFTEMFNNAIDHSGGSQINIEIAKTAINTQMSLTDDGVGIFKKIQEAIGLLDERHAILELSKGKLTTDPAKHTGQGIFFTSRLLDSFDILAGGVFFSHKFGKEDWIVEQEPRPSGTTVFMKLDNHTSRTDKQIFDQYSSGDDYGFTKTVVPVSLAQYGEDKLISRSQAKRVLARVDLFKTVSFDFAGVETIGQGFTDEIFRVFARSHPEIEIFPINANEQVARMVRSVQAAGTIFEDPRQANQAEIKIENDKV